MKHAITLNREIRKLSRFGGTMLGINDPWIWGVYLLSFLSALLCVAYGLANWNRGVKKEQKEILEEVAWEEGEAQMEEKELGL
jgi:hypothetical protein